MTSGSVLDFERQSCDKSGQDTDGEGAAGADTNIRRRYRGKKETQPGYLRPCQGVCRDQPGGHFVTLVDTVVSCQCTIVYLLHVVT